MESTVFEAFRGIIHEQCGIALNDDKEALVSARVSKRMRALQVESFDAYLSLLQQDRSGVEMIALLDVISTNVTSFFREADHFDFLVDALQTWKKSGQRRFRIWSAACSSGEEPYTIAMAAEELLAGCDFRILATDISTRILEFAKAARYSQKRVEHVPAAFLKRFFSRGDAKADVEYQLCEELRRQVVFSRLNLNNPPFPMKGPMDAVFCRNVMIYFDNDTRHGLLAEIYRLLKPGGFLFVGHSESLTGLTTHFKSVQPSVYQK